jgi:GntR family transcriptional regulator / MocR family aminotransferase
VRPGWSFPIALEDAARGGEPIFLRIARAVTDDVRRGRLRPGDPLPGTRALAETLGVHRNTVLAAYRELVAEGWATASAARGTFVSRELPDAAPRRFAAPVTEPPARVGYDLAPAPPVWRSTSGPPSLARGVLSLSGGIPDVRLVPTAALARAFRRALRTDARALLGYGDPRGPLALRNALASMLSVSRGLASSGENVIVTRGSQMALDLVARTLVAPGDLVLVEALGYRPAWVAMRSAGARVVGVPLDGRGIKTDAIAKVASQQKIRAVYVTPHHQYPTTVALSAGRRIELLALAARHRFAVIEDDYDHEFHYDGRPILPLASADRAGVVIYVGTLSKVLAPGLRIGYVVAPAPLLERLALLRASVDRQGDLPVEAAVAELLEDGEVQRHIRRARRIYEERRDLLVELLRSSLGSALAFDSPAGGTALWAKIDASIDVDAWYERGLTAGVAFQPARVFAVDGRSKNHARFGFAQLDPAELREAVKRLARALRPLKRRELG